MVLGTDSTTRRSSLLKLTYQLDVTRGHRSSHREAEVPIATSLELAPRRDPLVITVELQSAQMEDTYASTKRFYDVNAESYAEVTRALPMSDEIDSFVEQLPQGVKIVDLGCGAGRDLLAFSQRRVAAVGLDFSRPLAKLARDYSACPVVVGDLRILPFGTNSLGGAWASASLLHLQRSDVDLALAEIQRVLVPSGVFFSSLKCGKNGEMDTSGRWFSYFDQSDWIMRLRKAGFMVIAMRTSIQESGTIEKDQPVSWFSCIAKKDWKA